MSATKHRVIVSLAANCDQEKNLTEARQRLSQVLTDSLYTEELWTEPYGGGGGSMYLNQLVYASTTMEVEQLMDTLKQTEVDLGRNADERRQGIVRIDLDLMAYDDVHYHLRDWERPYILALLKD
jgi:2-amino-4-hydroxy-6-hydroxymethyldihydropteridine diphosphokinase